MVSRVEMTTASPSLVWSANFERERVLLELELVEAVARLRLERERERRRRALLATSESLRVLERWSLCAQESGAGAGAPPQVRKKVVCAGAESECLRRFIILIMIVLLLRIQVVIVLFFVRRYGLEQVIGCKNDRLRVERQLRPVRNELFRLAWER